MKINIKLKLITGLSTLLFSFSALAAVVDKLEPANLTSLEQHVSKWTGDASTSIAASILTFHVGSSGCTKASDFSLQIVVVGKTQHVKLVRNNMDMCRTISEPISIFIKTNGLKMARFYPVVFDNPAILTGEFSTPGISQEIEQ